MEYKLEVEDGGLRRLSFTCPAGEVLSAWKKAAQPFAASFRMAGFRPGKAPLEVVEKRFYQQISDAATDALVEAAVDDALRREALVPAAGLVYEGGNAVRGREFCFRMECCVLENGDVPDLSSIHIKEEEPLGRSRAGIAVCAGGSRSRGGEDVRDGGASAGRRRRGSRGDGKDGRRSGARHAYGNLPHASHADETGREDAGS